MLGNIGWSGLVLILIAVLIVFGPKRLPDIGKALGRTLREFRNATANVMESGDANESQSPAAEAAKAAQVAPMEAASSSASPGLNQSVAKADHGQAHVDD